MSEPIGTVQFHEQHGLHSGDLIELSNASPHALRVRVISANTVELYRPRWYHRLLHWLRLKRIKVPGCRF